jgi:excisionase family DNA binding protein
VPDPLEQLEPDDVGMLLRISRASVLGLIRTGQLGAVRISPRCFRVPRTELERFIAERRTDSEPARRRASARSAGALRALRGAT